MPDSCWRWLQQKRANQLQRRLKQARFPVMKTLEETDLKLWPGVDALRLRELAECEWIGRRENLLLIGRHGTGKSHAATCWEWKPAGGLTGCCSPPRPS